VRSIDAHTAEITVSAIRPGDLNTIPQNDSSSPTDADRQPNNMIQSDDPTVVAEGKQAAGTETDPWQMVLALERYVHQVITKKDYSQTFATAAEVAKSHEGDCTEHAVFLAALARARGIPARAAIGLVYMEGYQAFGYHMWTEVYVDGWWVSVDATLALGGIGAAHLMITETDLTEGTGYSAFLPVAQVVGRLHIDVLEVQ
jgi:transglutaminase-like putative cysteine protease